MALDLDKFRQVGDPLADDFIANYFSNADNKKKLDLALSKLKTNANWVDFLAEIPEAIFFDEELKRIGLVDLKIKNTALEFYSKKSTYILQLLGLLSLPYCYAAADGAMVLYQTERMYKDVAKRLEETGMFVASMMNPKGFDETGDAKVQLFKVRLMHAAGRYYILKGNWDDNLGLPVNQEDLAGTNLSFSLIVIRGLRKIGFTISYQEQMAYINYWSWIGAALGLTPELLPQNGKQALDLEKAISGRHFKPSLAGKQLIKSLLQCFYNLNDRKQIKNVEIAGFMRFLLGDKISDMLDVPKEKFPVSKQLLLKLKATVS
ncbi:oxygenase MpaB family protein [Pedobacter glucosidilyticus]|uniref:oxygenase MpaB family protein n=1 Tax=Pedobacter glucosidilyticus TaxID=1122941 RepID=UPI000412CBD1|nr:oxygenase MpaB family protein [Pedobacter glucosidilyticus]